MPLYDYKCTAGHKFTRLLRLEDYNQPQTCSCGCASVKQLSAPRVVADYPGYPCPVTGRWVEGRAAHRENLARTGCRLLEPGETTQAAQRRAQADEALDRSVEATTEQFIADLPAPKRDQLIAEVQGGLDVSFERL